MNFLALSNGEKMPTIGLGLSRVGGPIEVEETIDRALELGYRHFDTSTYYKSEIGLGNTLKKWIDSGKVNRKDLFITTKLPGVGNYPERVEQFLTSSLKSLQLDYVDLYLIHSPVGLTYKTENDLHPLTKDGKHDINKESNLEQIWKAMEIQVDCGHTKSIGISNFNINQIKRIIKISRIPPVNVQVEMNAYLQQPELRSFCIKNNITIVAYAPFGSPGRRFTLKDDGYENNCPFVLDDPIVSDIGKKYEKTNSQILIRFLIQLGVAAIPKSTNSTRLLQNIKVFDFNIEVDDMEQLKTLDKGEAGRIFTLEEYGFKEHPEYPFRKSCPKLESTS